jgi:hypothetical protein
MSRRVRISVLAALLLSGSAGAVIIFPPDGLLRWAAKAVAHSPIEWKSSSAARGNITLHSVRYPAGSIRLEADQVVLEHGLVRCLLSGVWKVDFRGPRWVPLDSRWPPIDFESGRAVWNSRSGILELRDWLSKLVRLDADLSFNPAGQLVGAQVRGDADPGELGKALAGWKLLKARSGEIRKTFNLDYKKGQLFIQVDQKPFFRASWTGTVNF